MKDKFTFRERRRLAKGRWWVPLLKLTSVDIAASQPESFLYSPFKPTESWLAHKWESDQSQCVILLSLSVWEREREREREKGKNRGSFGNLIIGGGAGTATWTMCFRLLLKCPKCLFTNIPKQTTFLVFFFFFLGKKYQIF